MDDVYCSITDAVEQILFKEKKSKFYGYCFPVATNDDIDLALKHVSKQHPKAKHICYAYQLGYPNTQWKVNDAGEPNNSAGMPILGQIQSKKLYDVLVVVLRYFGGVKLGVGGLIQSYKTSAQLTLDEAIIVEKTIEQQYELLFDYVSLSKVMRLIKEHNFNTLVNDQNEQNRLVISVKASMTELVESLLKELYDVSWKRL